MTDAVIFSLNGPDMQRYTKPTQIAEEKRISWRCRSGPWIFAAAIISKCFQILIKCGRVLSSVVTCRYVSRSQNRRYHGIEKFILSLTWNWQRSSVRWKECKNANVACIGCWRWRWCWHGAACWLGKTRRLVYNEMLTFCWWMNIIMYARVLPVIDL